MGRRMTYYLTDHACRHCGGRILEVGNPGATGGGNPVFMCADCERKTCGMDPSDICWCGMHQRGQTSGGEYFCQRVDTVKDQPWLADAFAHCGVDVRAERPRVQIGMMNREIERVCEQRWHDAQKRQNKGEE